MMYRELLILSLIGIKNKFISAIYLNLNDEEIHKILLGDVLEVQFLHNIFDEETMSLLMDSKKISDAKKQTEKILHYSNQKGIRIISIFDEAYPTSLKETINPPLFLYCLGNMNLLNSTHSISCVGTRHPSQPAVNFVRELIPALTSYEYTIISGLAYGIDYEAHKACLDSNGKTIAVLAHGLDRIYPKEHQYISNILLEKGGLLLSEYPVFTDIKRDNFVQRNRIISGISNGVIVVEADEKSGTMHTARFAFRQGKPIFCPSDNTSTGVQKLINTQNAYAVETYKDILDQLSIDLSVQNELKTNKSLEEILLKAHLKASLNTQVTENQKYKKYTTSINSDVYSRIQDLANINGITVKSVINAVLQSFIESYEEGNNNE